MHIPKKDNGSMLAATNYRAYRTDTFENICDFNFIIESWVDILLNLALKHSYTGITLNSLATMSLDELWGTFLYLRRIEEAESYVKKILF